jgi:adenosine deaminase
MSPSFDNVTTTPYEANPFFKFFSRGLKVSIATHNPVQLHVTTQALMEEYAISSQVKYLLSFSSLNALLID